MPALLRAMHVCAHECERPCAAVTVCRLTPLGDGNYLQDGPQPVDDGTEARMVAAMREEPGTAFHVCYVCGGCAAIMEAPGVPN